MLGALAIELFPEDPSYCLSAIYEKRVDLEKAVEAIELEMAADAPDRLIQAWNLCRKIGNEEKAMRNRLDAVGYRSRPPLLYARWERRMDLRDAASNLPHSASVLMPVRQNIPLKYELSFVGFLWR